MRKLKQKDIMLIILVAAIGIFIYWIFKNKKRKIEPVEKPITIPIKIKKGQCRNCGAPYSNSKCNYCQTIY